MALQLSCQFFGKYLNTCFWYCIPEFHFWISLTLKVWYSSYYFHLHHPWWALRMCHQTSRQLKWCLFSASTCIVHTTHTHNYTHMHTVLEMERTVYILSHSIYISIFSKAFASAAQEKHGHGNFSKLLL